MDQYDAALDLLRRLDPKHTATHLANLTKLCPSLTEDLLTSVDQPLTVRRCKATGRDYLLCDYNRDGDSYRSPWSNAFDPPLEVESEQGEGSMPNDRVRRMEIAANDAIDVYREMYYEGGVSSVYFWNLDDGFAGVVLIKKASSKGGARDDGGGGGVWDSIHVFEAVDRARTCHYKLTSTVILQLTRHADDGGLMDLSGNMTRQVEQDMPVEQDASHIGNVGRMVEDMELKMRNLLQDVYFGKARDVVADLRSLQGLAGLGREKAQHREMIDAMRK